MQRFAMGLALAMSLLGQANVPFVGCETHGMQDLDAPKGTPTNLPISAGAAKRLALYSGLGRVLAPRGWHCSGWDGSSGGGLLVTPEPTNQQHVAGPAVLIDHFDSGASGRFDIAEVVARVFPAHKDFAAQVREGFEFIKFLDGPYPADRLNYRSPEMVEYETPPQTEGLGVWSLLQKNADPIRGVAILTNGTDGPDLVFLAVRLPAEQAGLAATIVQQVEHETPVYHK